MKRFAYIFIFLLSLLTAGCVEENLDECEVRIKLLFSYFGDGDTEIFSEKQMKVNLYVYDNAQMFVQKKEINKDELDNLQGSWLSLLAGNYTIVCWGNVMEQAEEKQNINRSLHISAAGITHCPGKAREDNAIQTIDSLYYGKYLLSVPETHKLIKDTLITDVINFESAHIKYRVAIKGLDKVFPGVENPVTLLVNNMPLSYDFEKKTTEEKCSYKPSLIENSASLSHCAFNSMRLPNKNNVVFKLYRNDMNMAFYSFALTDFLKAQHIDVESRQEVTVPILIEFTEPLDENIEVSITVKRWNEISLEPDFQNE